MPPRKEPKETVVYPSSKRKAPPFKPQRPSKVPRIPTTESESSSRPSSARASTARPSAYIAARKGPPKQVKDGDGADTDEADEEAIALAGSEASGSDEELADDPLAARPTKSSGKPPEKRNAAPMRGRSPMSLISSQPASSPPQASLTENQPPLPSQLDNTPAISQPLLLRLLHEHFADKTTKIDKHAIQVLQKYVEVFVREAIARTALRKEEAAERGEVDKADVRWLELEDLEKVAAGMMLDF